MTLSTTAAATRSISLIGPPNAGKTTLFNFLTGANYKTVNYPGSTVTFSVGPAKASLNLPGKIYDSPGIASLHPATLDQQVTLEHLVTDAGDHLIVAVADATQLSRHLYLVDQLIESGFEVVLCVTMLDLLQAEGKHLEAQALSEQLGGIPVFCINARCPATVVELIETLRCRGEAGGTSAVRRKIVIPEKPSQEVVRARFAKLEAIEKEVIRRGAWPVKEKGFDWDDVLLHPVWGGLIFVAMMVGVFTSIFSLAVPFMDGIDWVFGWLIEQTHAMLPASWLTDLLADGLIAGMGAVLVFLPQIVILFLFMGFLEDWGYLARGALVVDKPLSKIGLHGKSFVPMLSGFACAIPAILATRTIGSRRERLLTILVIPLMTCSARLPVYAILLAFLLRGQPAIYSGLALAGLYVGGIVSGTIAATILSRLPALRKQKRSPLLLELPRMRRPVAKVVLMNTFHRSMNYLKRAGPTIVAIALGLWLLTHLPAVEQSGGGEREYVTVENSYAAKLGHLIEPVMEPMGLDWRGGVSMMMGFAAREVFVSSLALVYRVEEGDDEDSLKNSLLARMDEVTFAGTDRKIFTVSSCIGLLFFFAIALQCFPTVVTARAEIGAWKWPLFQLTAYTGIAYLGAVAIVQGLRFFGVP